jgi:hypothetical protein
MIIDKKVKVRINSKNYNYYKDLIINIKNNNIYEIDIKNLYPTSRVKINVVCDICNKKSYKPYREYRKSFLKRNIYCCSPSCALFKNKLTNNEIYKCDNPFQNELIKEKIRNTNIEKYGVEYPTQSKHILDKIKVNNFQKYGVFNVINCPEIYERMKKTNLLKYGSEFFFSSKNMEEIRISIGSKIPDILKSGFDIYQNRVRYLTNRNKPLLLEEWNGNDYYDGEYIRNNFYMKFHDKKYPTIDHKISIYYGFINNIDPEEISKIENLCLTKRGNNSSKGTKNR